MRQRTDVLIVGARVAGSVLAAQLGDAGFDVTLVDAAVFPSPTLSTHFFRGAGMVDVLDGLGVLDEVLRLGPPKLTREYFYSGAKKATMNTFESGGRCGFHLSVRREPLDHLLVRRAVRAGRVTFLDATRLRELLRDGSRVVGARFERAGQDLEIASAITVGADGRSSTVARLAGTLDSRNDPATRAVYYAYVEGFRPPAGDRFDGPEYSLAGDELAYVFPSDAGVTCLALSVNLERFRAMRTRYAEAFWERFAGHPELTERVLAATPTGEVFAYGPQPSYVRRPALSGALLVGDAGIHLDPWSGHGMDFAGRHACYAAEAIADVLRGGDEAQAWSRFHQRRDDHALQDYRATTDLAKDLSRLVA